MFRHVLFPTDFSATAEAALGYLEQLARQGVEKVTLLHALEAPGCEEYPQGYRETAEAVGRNFLEKWRQRLQDAGFPQVQTQLTPGHPIPVILEVLKPLDCSLIIMGTQGRGFIKEIFLGSVAHNVSRLAGRPILLIPPETR